MNYCEKIRYNIYTTEKADFEEMVDKLLAQLPQNEQIFRLAFLGMPDDNEQYFFQSFGYIRTLNPIDPLLFFLPRKCH